MDEEQEDNLKCCDQKDTLKCEAAHTANHLTILSVANSCDGRDDCKCGGGYIWSSFREQCIPLFKGAPPRIETDDITTEVSEDTTEVVIVYGGIILYTMLQYIITVFSIWYII